MTTPAATPPSPLQRLFGFAGLAAQPVRAMIEVTHRCHLSCSHCYLHDHHRWDSRPDELSTAELLSLVEQLHAAGCLFLSFTGGEVFLRPDLWTVLTRARELGLAISLLTTGTLLSPRLVTRLAELQPWRVELSLYSLDPQVHDGITQRAGSHRRTRLALDRLRAAGIPVLIKCPVMAANFESYEGLRDLAAELGIPFVADLTLTPRHDGALEPTQRRLSQEQIVSFYARSELRRFGSAVPQLPRADAPICAIGRRSCMIGPYGDVYACGSLRTPVGNVRQQPFATIWRDSPLLARLRGLTAGDLTHCSGCEKFGYCNRCAALALDEHGELLGPSAWACRVAAAKEQASGLVPTPSAAQRQGWPGAGAAARACCGGGSCASPDATPAEHHPCGCGD